MSAPVQCPQQNASVLKTDVTDTTRRHVPTALLRALGLADPPCPTHLARAAATMSSGASLSKSAALSWDALAALGAPPADLANGPASAQSRLRLFGTGAAPSDVRVTLYRDHHAWCPYCQKIWLWLEESQVPYRVEKVRA